MRVALLVATGLVPAACTSAMNETGTIEQGACTALEGRTFASINELECGLTPDGVGRCKWQVAFEVDSAESSQFTWLYSDIGEFGHVRCVSGAVEASTSNRSIPATFDPATLRLTWAGEIYVAQ